MPNTRPSFGLASDSIRKRHQFAAHTTAAVLFGVVVIDDNLNSIHAILPPRIRVAHYLHPLINGYGAGESYAVVGSVGH
jgi:hypothetical protein